MGGQGSWAGPAWVLAWVWLGGPRVLGRTGLGSVWGARVLGRAGFNIRVTVKFNNTSIKLDSDKDVNIIR